MVKYVGLCIWCKWRCGVMWRNYLVWFVLVVILLCNYGFCLSICEAFGPYDAWSSLRWMHDYWAGYGAGIPGFSGSPRSGAGYDAYGYCYFNMWSGPPMPKTNFGVGSISFYSPYSGPGGKGDGWDGYLYGFYVPGAISLYGLYGLGIPSGYRLYGGWN